jgi:hypothetical protein
MRRQQRLEELRAEVALRARLDALRAATYEATPPRPSPP